MKSPEAFRTISEAADELGVPQHVLRFWETKFSFIRPMKRAGGRRFYRRQDIEVLRGVQGLLHGDGYTIKGVQRLHREQGMRRVLAATLAVDAGEDPPASPAPFLRVEEPDPFVLSPLGRPVLSDQARGLLLDALADLEKTKARLDAELAARIS